MKFADNDRPPPEDGKDRKTDASIIRTQPFFDHIFGQGKGGKLNPMTIPADNRHLVKIDPILFPEALISQHEFPSNLQRQILFPILKVTLR